MRDDTSSTSRAREAALSGQSIAAPSIPLIDACPVSAIRDMRSQRRMLPDTGTGWIPCLAVWPTGRNSPAALTGRRGAARVASRCLAPGAALGHRSAAGGLGAGARGRVRSPTFRVRPLSLLTKTASRSFQRGVRLPEPCCYRRVEISGTAPMPCPVAGCAAKRETRLAWRPPGEIAGSWRNDGRTWTQPLAEAHDPDCPMRSAGRAAPYGSRDPRAHSAGSDRASPSDPQAGLCRVPAGGPGIPAWHAAPKRHDPTCRRVPAATAPRSQRPPQGRPRRARAAPRAGGPQAGPRCRSRPVVPGLRHRFRRCTPSIIRGPGSRRFPPGPSASGVNLPVSVLSRRRRCILTGRDGTSRADAGRCRFPGDAPSVASPSGRRRRGLLGFPESPGIRRQGTESRANETRAAMSRLSA